MPQLPDRLTHAEIVCLRLAARGQDPTGISHELGENLETVEKHLSSARRKLMASTTMEAVARALKYGLIE
tara:strand:- start:2468 stop:2677 length:210 start_codon:yes stop_codon:yes gene_type:complete